MLFRANDALLSGPVRNLRNNVDFMDLLSVLEAKYKESVVAAISSRNDQGFSTDYRVGGCSALHELTRALRAIVNEAR